MRSLKLTTCEITHLRQYKLYSAYLQEVGESARNDLASVTRERDHAQKEAATLSSDLQMTHQIFQAQQSKLDDTKFQLFTYVQEEETWIAQWADN